MKCIVCHGQDIQVQGVKEEIRLGDDVVYVPVEIAVCQTCGERYYDRQTMRYLEKVEQELRAGNGKLSEVGRLLRYG